MKATRVIFLLFLLPALLAAGRPGWAAQAPQVVGLRPQAAESGLAAPFDLELVEYTWSLAQDGREARLVQRLALGPGLARLLRGSQALEPAGLQARLAAEGALEPACALEDAAVGTSAAEVSAARLVVTCRSRLALPPERDGWQDLPAPGPALPGLLSGLPVEMAAGLRLETRGDVTVLAALGDLPPAESRPLPAGGSFERKTALISLHRLLVSEHETHPPGDPLPIPAGSPLVFHTLLDYRPEPTAWWAFGAALLACLALLEQVFPARRSELAPAAGSLPGWLRRLWPGAFRLLAALALTAAGALLLILAWAWPAPDAWPAAGPAPVEALLAALPPLPLPLAPDPQALGWAGCPWLLGAAGAGLAALGAGLMLARDWARRLAAAGALALIASWAAGWAMLLLLPPLVPWQTFLLFALGMAGLGVLGLAYRLLTHPHLRGAFAARS
jgi:hypothetical protein